MYPYLTHLLFLLSRYLQSSRWIILVGGLFFCLWQEKAKIQAQDLSLFEALQLPVDAGVAALGDYNVSHTGNNVALIWQNPSLVNVARSTELAFSFVDYYADIRAGASTWRSPIKAGAFSLGFRYLSYGKMPGYDEKERFEGHFSAHTHLLMLCYGHSLGPFALGISFLPALVSVEQARAYGFFSDLGATFRHPRKELRLGMVIKHVPWLRRSRYSHLSENSPMNLWIGASYRPPEFPFRFSANLYGLGHKTYYHDPQSPIQAHQKSASWLFKTLSKCNFGLELLLAKVLELSSALTVARRQQLQTNEINGLAGFSFGGTLKLRAFRLRATRSFHEVQGGRTHLGLQINFSALHIKKETTITHQK